MAKRMLELKRAIPGCSRCLQEEKGRRSTSRADEPNGMVAKKIIDLRHDHFICLRRSPRSRGYFIDCFFNSAGNLPLNDREIPLNLSKCSKRVLPNGSTSLPFGDGFSEDDIAEVEKLESVFLPLSHCNIIHIFTFIWQRLSSILVVGNRISATIFEHGFPEPYCAQRICHLLVFQLYAHSPPASHPGLGHGRWKNHRTNRPRLCAFCWYDGG